MSYLDQEEVPDWTLLAELATKRGHKSFEPVYEGSTLSQYDVDALEKHRSIMYHALCQPRGFLSQPEKLISSTIRLGTGAYIDQPRGKYLETMGRMDRSGRCHLNFEEALYLVERGTCVAKKEDSEGILSLQEVYGILITNSEQYDQLLVYSLLKRNGYIVLRATQHTSECHDSTRFRYGSVFLNFVVSLFGLKFLPFRSIFNYLHSLIAPKKFQPSPTPNWQPVYDIWKPFKGFKKSMPPVPHFQVVIVSATDQMPEIETIKQHLHESPSLLVAVVDNGIVNFYNLAQMDLSRLGIAWKDSWGYNRTLWSLARSLLIGQKK
ncbi:hypothetical protein KL936_004031 [Ogataea polymorpha]|nr:hypothetical protein KL936_004031 [Ogataea polymorpha]